MILSDTESRSCYLRYFLCRISPLIVFIISLNYGLV
jgi:hypothetical protein